jgi:hypothetical protein
MKTIPRKQPRARKVPIMTQLDLEANSATLDHSPHSIEEFQNEADLSRHWKLATTIAAIWSVASITFLWMRRFSWLEQTREYFSLELFAAFFLTSGIVGPAVWFAWDASNIKPADKETKPNRMARWKLATSTAKTAWVAIAALAAALYFAPGA